MESVHNTTPKFPQTIGGLALFSRLMIRSLLVGSALAGVIALLRGGSLPIDRAVSIALFVTCSLAVYTYVVAIVDYFVKRARFKDTGTPIHLGVDSFQTKVIEVPEGLEDIESVIRNALRKIGDGCEVSSPRTGYFVCNKRRTRKRPATTVGVEVQHSTTGTYLVLSSQNAERGLPGDRMIFDYGESLNNVLSLERDLRSVAGLRQ